MQLSSDVIGALLGRDFEIVVVGWQSHEFEGSQVFGSLIEQATGLRRVSLEGDWPADMVRELGRMKNPVVVAPWGPSADDTHSFEERALQAIIQRLGPLGLHILVPSGIANAHRYRELRRAIWASRRVSQLAFGQAQTWGLAGIQNQFRMVAVSLTAESNRCHGARIVQLERLMNAGLAPAALRKKLKHLGNPGAESDFGYHLGSKEELETWAYTANDPRTARSAQALHAQVSTLPLGKLALSIRPGQPRHRAKQAGELLRARSLRDLDLLDGRGFARTGSGTVQTNDVLVGRAWMDRPLTAVVPPHLSGVVADQSVFVIRFSEPSRELADLVADFLGSDFAVQQLRAGLGTGMHLNVTCLSSLPVPNPASPHVEHLVRLRRVGEELGLAAAEFETARRQAFGPGPLRESLANLEELAVRAALFEDMLAASADPSARIRRTYPHPLALMWRSVELEHDPVRKFQEVLSGFESVGTFLGAMAIANDRGAGRPAHANVIGLLEKIRGRGRGPSGGDWREVFAVRGRDAGDGIAPFPELDHLSADGSWLAAVRLLSKYRNDHAHQRGPRTTVQFGRALDDVVPALHGLLGSLAFLAKYPLRNVLAVRFDPLDGTRSVQVEELVGDHPVLPRRTVEVRGELGPDMLYIVDQHGQHQLVSPWLTYGECPTSGNMEVAAPEHVSKDGSSLLFKGLNRGTMRPEPAEVVDRLRAFVGLSD